MLITDAQGKLVGIFTHGDLARLMEGDASLDKRAPIAQLMGKKPKSIGSEQLVEEAMRRMQEHRVDQIPVVDANGRPIGLLDVQDLLDVRV